MVEVLSKNPDGDFLAPAEMKVEYLRYWSKHFKTCLGSDRLKAERFLLCDCIQYVGDDAEFGLKGVFICLPLNTKAEYSEPVPGGVRLWAKRPHAKDYNFSAYKLYFNGSVWVCNCQGWQSRAKRGGVEPDAAGCSHVLALYGAFKLGRFKHEGGE